MQVLLLAFYMWHNVFEAVAYWSVWPFLSDEWDKTVAVEGGTRHDAAAKFSRQTT